MAHTGFLQADTKRPWDYAFKLEVLIDFLENKTKKGQPAGLWPEASVVAVHGPCQVPMLPPAWLR